MSATSHVRQIGRCTTGARRHRIPTRRSGRAAALQCRESGWWPRPTRCRTKSGSSSLARVPTSVDHRPEVHNTSGSGCTQCCERCWSAAALDKGPIQCVEVAEIVAPIRIQLGGVVGTAGSVSSEPRTDASIMTGKNMNIERRVVAVPEVKYNVIIPPVATSMATGSRRAIGFAGKAFGTSGGASSEMSPSAIGGAESRGSRQKSIV